MSSLTTQLNNTLGTGSSGTSAASVASANAALIASGLNGTTSSSSTGSTQTDANKLLGTTTQFLNILLAQLKYQDPTQPMKGTEFIDSIARLSDVEQNINVNTNLNNIANILKSSNSQLGSPISYINKSIEFNSSQFALTNGSGTLDYTLPATGTPNNVTVVVKDANGNTVLTKAGSTNPGENAFNWNGKDGAGNQLPDGLYTASVTYPDPKTANSANPASISLPTYTTGVVTGADFTGTTPVLNVGNIAIPLTAVRKLNGGSNVASSESGG